MNKQSEGQECEWVYDEHLDRWKTLCGKVYYDFADSLHELDYHIVSEFKFCPYCSKPIFLRRYEGE